MRIERIDVYQVTYKLVDHEYSWSNNNSVDRLVSTLVKVTADGVHGWGEVCPLGPAYMAAHAGGVPAAIAEFGPGLIGLDPTRLRPLNDAMDRGLMGHAYAKSPVDMACWDILGKVSGLSVAELMGGRFVDGYPPYRPISQSEPEKMADELAMFREKGYRRFQLKVGGDMRDDIERIEASLDAMESGEVLVADANTGWTSAQAITIARAFEGDSFYMEQPCPTYDQSLRVRRNVTLPFNLDEVIDSFEVLNRAISDGAMDGVNLKISRWGGLTKAKLARDICEQAGLMMTLEDSWGGDVTAAAIAAFAGSVNPQYYLSSTDFDDDIDLHVAPDAPRRKDGLVPVPTSPGLGITVDESLLGEPVVTIK
jgi:L-alanine-DL-glutamate epimerase-like enolase superfamily enzyme